MNKWNTTSYIGITSRLSERIWNHRQKAIAGFTARYNLSKLVYYEVFDSSYNAITREKQLKKWSRKKKVALIKKINPNFIDLSKNL